MNIHDFFNYNHDEETVIVVVNDCEWYYPENEQRI